MNRPCISTRVVSFDGEGIDPSRLHNCRVLGYDMTTLPPCLNLVLSDQVGGRLVARFAKRDAVADAQDRREIEPYEVCMDENLRNALSSFRGGRDTGPLIIQAVLGTRRGPVKEFWEPGYRTVSHRVVGLQLEGMSQIGYIYCKTESDDESKNFDEYALNLHDVDFFACSG